jgi:hypothetical protein
MRAQAPSCPVSLDTIGHDRPPRDPDPRAAGRSAGLGPEPTLVAHGPPGRCLPADVPDFWNTRSRLRSQARRQYALQQWHYLLQVFANRAYVTGPGLSETLC